MVSEFGFTRQANPHLSINVNGRLLTFEQPRVMGILNLTPDSFYAGSRILADAIVETAGRMLDEGADILDLGAMSTRPGAEEISAEAEIDRILPALQAVASAFPQAILSADTYRAVVADEALHAGASIINDVGAGRDADMYATVARHRAVYILMHSRGTPATMNQLTGYDNLLLDITQWAASELLKLKEAGVTDVIFDPGFGFAKTVEQNFIMLQHLEWFSHLGCPLLVGLSRKSTIWKTLNTTPENALNGTTVLNTVALMKGANILRVHDVQEAKEAVTLIEHLAKS